MSQYRADNNVYIEIIHLGVASQSKRHPSVDQESCCSRLCKRRFDPRREPKTWLRQARVQHSKP